MVETYLLLGFGVLGIKHHLLSYKNVALSGSISPSDREQLGFPQLWAWWIWHSYSESFSLNYVWRAFLFAPLLSR